jgi:hypothetical protein
MQYGKNNDDHHHDSAEDSNYFIYSVAGHKRF